MTGPASLHYIAFPSLHERPLSISGRLQFPDAQSTKLPAVLILHGSAGPSGREGGYAAALNAAGFATLEPDQWSARGLKGGADGRPRTVMETLPDVYGARKFLANHSRIDPARIAVMGFSFGAVASMLSATHACNDRYDPQGAFAAYMPVYPVCWVYNNVAGYAFGDLVPSPVCIVAGALDQYDNDPAAAQTLLASLAPRDRARIEVHVMDDAHHGFDMPGIDVEVRDPMGNRGAGGGVIMRHNPEATARSHALAVAFFSRTMR